VGIVDLEANVESTALAQSMALDRCVSSILPLSQKFSLESLRKQHRTGTTPLYGYSFTPDWRCSGNVTAVSVAIKNNMDLSVSVAMGSSLLVALFMAPLLVLVGQAIGQPMDLDFNPFEAVAVDRSHSCQSNQSGRTL